MESLGIVYKITCNKTNKCYYGSTTQSLAKRKSLHKMRSNTSSSKEIIDGDDWKIETVEDVKYKDKKELLERERYFIDNFECVNKNRPIVSEQERKEQLKTIMRKWYELNREEHIKRATEYNVIHHEKHKENMRNYYHRKKQNQGSAPPF